MTSRPTALSGFLDRTIVPLFLAVTDVGAGTDHGFEQANVYRAFFELAPAGLFILDQERRVRHSNAAGQRLFGPPGAPLAGRPIFDFVSSASRAALEQAFAALAAKGGTSPLITAEGRDEGGASFPIEIFILKLRPWAEEGYGFVVRDLRERPTVTGRPGAPKPGGPSGPYTLGELLMADRLRELV